MTGFSDYTQYDATGLADLVRRREVTAAELVEAAIARIEALNGPLNAVVTKLYDQARAAAANGPPDGPFAGVPFLVKDLIATVEGVPTSSGNKLLRSLPAPVDSELVRRWRAAGLIILGKTNTPEFGLTPYTESLTLGAARNPWDTSRTPGGSSGGSGAAVAARMVPMASGGDGGGSIRIPASACGLFGIKPTRGRTPTGPLIGESWHGFAIEHALTRSVRDSAALLDATHGPDIGAPYAAPAVDGTFLAAAARAPGRLRIAVTSKPLLGRMIDPAVVDGFRASVTLLANLGHEIIEAAPDCEPEVFSIAFITVLAGELRADMEAAARAAGKVFTNGDFDPTTCGMGMLGRAFSATEYAAAVRALQRIARQVAAMFEDIDVLMTPTLAMPPVRIGALQPSNAERALIRLVGAFDGGWLLRRLGIVKPLAEKTFEFVPWTPVFNVTGQPAMSVPLNWTPDGLPIGMHFVAKFGAEDTLFSLAAQLEAAQPWQNKVPPGC
jgi:amidase